LTGISLLILVVAIVGSGVVMVVRGLRLKRSFVSFNGTVTTALAVVTETAALTEARALTVSDGTERLTEATAKLQASIAQLRVLQAALAEVRDKITGVREVIPKK
jgi:hypothetical protein